jgi:hypothetical protein
MSLDQHPAGKGQDDLARCNAGCIFEDHESEHAKPAKFVEDHL